MRRRLFALFLLLTLLLGYLAYLNSLPPAVRAYKLARIPSDEQLIAVYHDKNFWQFATYNPKTQKLKVYALYTDKPILPWGKDVKTVKTPLNYSPLALDLKLLEKAPKETPALLFNGKWYTKENPPGFPTLDEITKEYKNKSVRQITVYTAKKELWVRSIRVFNDGSVGPLWELVVPSLRENTSEAFIWEVERPVNESISFWEVHYPGRVILRGNWWTVYPGTFKVRERIMKEAFNDINRSPQLEKGVFLQVTLHSGVGSNTINVDALAISKYWSGISMEKGLDPGYVVFKHFKIPKSDEIKEPNP